MDKEYFASINEVSREMGLPAHTLRYWEKQFPTVVRPIAGAGGRRYYRPETVSRLKTIQDLLYNRGMTIAGVKKMIHNGDFLVMNTAESTPAPAHQTEYDDIHENNSVPVASSFDTTKIDLAIGLLTQAREMLE